MKRQSKQGGPSPAIQRRRRMALSLAASTLIVLAALLLLPGLPASTPPGSGPVMTVTLVPQQEPQGPASRSGPAPAPVVQGMRTNPATIPKATAGDAEAPPEPPVRPKPDWYAALASVARRSEEFIPGDASLSPAFDEARRVAAMRFAPSRAPVSTPVWDRVEPDQLGRKVLRQGNCYRVLEDNAVTRQWVHENFTQYLIFCENDEAPAPIRLALTSERLADFRHGGVIVDR